MEIVSNVSIYKTLINEAKQRVGHLHTNAYYYVDELESIIFSGRMFYQKTDGGVLFFVDESKYYQLYYFITLNEQLKVERIDKPILIRTIYTKDRKTAIQTVLDNLFLDSGFTLLDSTIQVYTDVEDNLKRMEMLYDRAEKMLNRQGFRIIVATQEYREQILKIRENEPELKMFHFRFRSEQQELNAIREGRYCCVLNQEGIVCGAREIEHVGHNLYSPWFCVKHEYKRKYGIGLALTGFEMKYAHAHNMSKVYGWIAKDNKESLNYHKRLGVCYTGKEADEWVL